MPDRDIDLAIRVVIVRNQLVSASSVWGRYCRRRAALVDVPGSITRAPDGQICLAIPVIICGNRLITRRTVRGCQRRAIGTVYRTKCVIGIAPYRDVGASIAVVV